jgi:hypothetical protein
MALQATAGQYMAIRGEADLHATIPAIEHLLASVNAPEMRWVRPAVAAAAALAYAEAGRGEDAQRAIAGVLPVIERAAGWAAHYPQVVYTVIEALWVLESRRHVEVLEQNLREKILAPDFRFIHTDARLALA